MATIKDIAKRAGVSTSTVSNILNNKVTVGEETYQAVMGAMKELNYRPNLMARSLKNNKVKLLGVVMPSISGIYKDILYGIQRCLSDKEYYIISKVTDGYESK